MKAKLEIITVFIFVIVSGALFWQFFIKEKVENVGTNNPFFNNLKALSSIEWTEHNHLQWSTVAPQFMDWDQASMYCESIGGRLPTVSEMRTLIQNCPNSVSNGECGVSDSCLEASCTSKCGEKVKTCEFRADGHYSAFSDTGIFHTSSFIKNEKDQLFQINFGNAVITSGYRHNRMSIRCVRDKAKSSFRGEMKLSLWSPGSPETMSYSEARKYCEDMKIQKGGNWRLPQMSELTRNLSYRHSSYTCNEDRCLLRSEVQGPYYDFWVLTEGVKIKKNEKEPSFSGVIEVRPGDDLSKLNKGHAVCINRKDDQDDEVSYYCSDNDCPPMIVNNWFFPPNPPQPVPVAVSTGHFTGAAADPSDNDHYPNDDMNHDIGVNTGYEYNSGTPIEFDPYPLPGNAVFTAAPIIITMPLH